MALTGGQLADAEQRKEKLIGICRALPETSIEPAESHLAFRIRRKTFGYYLFDHHGDGMIAFCYKSSLNEQKRLVSEDAESFFVPAYLGSRGWVAIRMDLASVDWEAVEELAKRAYQETAPRKLSALVEFSKG